MDDLPVINAEFYIGNGVFASFDGWQIWLWAGDSLIALEPEVYQGLCFWMDSYALLKAHMEGHS